MGQVLVVDDDRAVRHVLTAAFADTEHDVIAAEDVDVALKAIREQEPDVVLLDIELPEINGFEAFNKIKALDSKLPVIYITGGGTSNTAIESMKLGAYDYLLKPLDLALVRELVDRAMEIRRLMRVPVEMSSVVEPSDKGDQIIGSSPQMQEVFKAIGRVAPQNVTVLVRGESGTGKELVARAIYQHSDRRDKPFLAINCAAIPEQLLESELFGHEKGAFSGAERQRVGKFEQCDGGTIFLDEIGDMPPLLQSKILRLLQQQEFQRVGGNDTVKVDVRIIAATNRDLEAMVADGEYREDLLYRLNGYSINLPPLRERGSDLTTLTEHFLARISKQLNRETQGVTQDAWEALRSYHWPGNVRELEGVLRQTLLQGTGSIVAAEFLPQVVFADAENGKQSTAETGDDDDGGLPYNLKQFVQDRLDKQSADVYAETLQMMERYLISRILSLANGNQSETARILGITRGSLRHKIRALGISIESRIESGE